MLLADVDARQHLRRLSGKLVAVSEQLSDARVATEDPEALQQLNTLACSNSPPVEDEIARFGVPGAAEFEGLETRLRQGALEFALRALELRFNDDRSNHAGPLRQLVPHDLPDCLGKADPAARLFHRPVCTKGFVPRGGAQGNQRTDLSQGGIRMTSMAVALGSFWQMSGLLDDLAGI